MTNSTQNETHNVCNERLAREGGQARCCDCEPHEGCTLGDHIVPSDKKVDTQNDWAKKAEDWFVDVVEHDNSEYSYTAKFNSLLAVIEEIRADARKEVEAKIEKMKKSYQKPLAEKVMERIYDCDVTAYNKALDEVLATLENRHDYKGSLIVEDDILFERLNESLKPFVATLLADARKDERMKAEIEMGLKNFKVTMEEISKARKEGYEKGYQDGIEGKESAYKYAKATLKEEGTV